ncbi:mitochondrial carrier domain-containing protein [Lentinula detonsa]|uniref:Mitochondrial carrier domain-containing protein n=1 Tax=Lentinula detonsa TaxID=2804962 RepID=A0AA38UV44_9AGAR|nr:mitochondrial carrier domain-containing protein [Lentinula detonsa]
MHSDGASRPSSKNEVSQQSVGEDAVISMRAAALDVAFGSIAGMVSEVFEYPFDLAKVRLQSQLLSPTSSDGQPRFKGPMDCLMQTWRDEGFKGLYRGLPVPLVGSMAETAAVFVAYSSLKNVIHRYYDSPNELTIPQLCLAAAGAGAATSFILTPIELVKCKLQVQMMTTPTPARIPPIHVPVTPKFLPKNPSSSSIYAPHSATAASIPVPSSSLPGPFSIARHVVATNGIRGLWLGHTGTVLRETGGTAVWFAVKEWVARGLKDRRAKADSSLLPAEQYPSTLLPWESAFSGAISGAVCVAALYPADTVKSAMQTEEELREMRTYQKRASSAAREWSTSSSSVPSLSGSSPSTSSPNAFPTTTASSKVLPKPSSSIPTSIIRKTSSKAAAAASIESMSFLETFLKIYRTHGMKGLYSGCGMSMARAVPSSGIVFLVYDGLTAWFS